MRIWLVWLCLVSGPSIQAETVELLKNVSISQLHPNLTEPTTGKNSGKDSPNKELPTTGQSQPISHFPTEDGFQLPGLTVIEPEQVFNSYSENETSLWDLYDSDAEETQSEEGLLQIHPPCLTPTNGSSTAQNISQEQRALVECLDSDSQNQNSSSTSVPIITLTPVHKRDEDVIPALTSNPLPKKTLTNVEPNHPTGNSSITQNQLGEAPIELPNTKTLLTNEDFETTFSQASQNSSSEDSPHLQGLVPPLPSENFSEYESQPQNLIQKNLTEHPSSSTIPPPLSSPPGEDKESIIQFSKEPEKPRSDFSFQLKELETVNSQQNSDQSYLTTIGQTSQEGKGNSILQKSLSNAKIPPASPQSQTETPPTLIPSFPIDSSQSPSISKNLSNDTQSSVSELSYPTTPQQADEGLQTSTVDSWSSQQLQKAESIRISPALTSNSEPTIPTHEQNLANITIPPISLQTNKKKNDSLTVSEGEFFNVQEDGTPSQSPQSLKSETELEPPTLEQGDQHKNDESPSHATITRNVQRDGPSTNTSAEAPYHPSPSFQQTDEELEPPPDGISLTSKTPTPETEYDPQTLAPDSNLQPSASTEDQNYEPQSQINPKLSTEEAVSSNTTSAESTPLTTDDGSLSPQPQKLETEYDPRTPQTAIPSKEEKQSQRVRFLIQPKSSSQSSVPMTEEDQPLLSVISSNSQNGRTIQSAQTSEEQKPPMSSAGDSSNPVVQQTQDSGTEGGHPLGTTDKPQMSSILSDQPKEEDILSPSQPEDVIVKQSQLTTERNTTYPNTIEQYSSTSVDNSQSPKVSPSSTVSITSNQSKKSNLSQVNSVSPQWSSNKTPIPNIHHIFKLESAIGLRKIRVNSLAPVPTPILIYNATNT